MNAEQRLRPIRGRGRCFLCVRMRKKDISGEYAAVRLIPTETWGAEKCHLFSFDVR